MGTERIIPNDPLGFIQKCIAERRVYCYLIYFRQGQDVYHVLIATDVAGGNVRIVTAYRPDPAHWSEDLKRRK